MDWYRISLVLVTWSSATAAIKSPNTCRVKCTLDLAVNKRTNNQLKHVLNYMRYGCLAKETILLWVDPFLTKDHLIRLICTYSYLLRGWQFDCPFIVSSVGSK